ncbi:hypothetical protein PMAYCL1PPCAC_27263 [Pristionchus mayeri]|uniref:Carboxylesterase type B domain-containing protein n=1 Tax=Pristionchus mayeri TaxID=1317129 RepID=A0AAN5D5T2_9BILA|nr:hypothetical protein PMAYCL1PPCAC_27263 [Pristionchus mayeri]
MESLAKLLFTTDSHDPLPINVDTPYSPVITARDGKIQGRRMINEADFKADAYLGIPFASPPVGDLRFRKPVPPKDWSGIRQCFKHPTASVQISDKVTFCKWPSSEDCLYLNVFCPGDNIGKKFPVMVFIHGGAHAFSYIKKYGDQGLCDGLVRRGVIVVTVQYRLGILGFFSTGDEVCPGNFGLWDQIEALKWVQENIEHFGGDKNNVTLFGQCSGGVCADLISLSPYSRGLIHRLIPMSGNANATWAHQKSIADYCKKYAGTKLGIFAESNDELIEKLRCVPADQLRVRVYFRNIGWRETIRNFCPVIDGDLLPHAIEELRRTAPVLPLMAGVTTLEGGLSLRPKDVHEDSIRQAIDAMLPKGARRETRDSLVTLYKDVGVRRQPEHAVWRARVELSSDRMYNIPTVKLLTECSGKGAPTYLYVFSYYNPKCIGREAHFAPCSEASHSCDLAYVFNAGVDEHFEFSEDDKQMAETMTRAFINFTKRGNPNDVGSSTWLPCDAEHPGRHMVLDLNPRVEDDFNEGRCEKWLELFKQEHYLKSSL